MMSYSTWRVRGELSQPAELERQTRRMLEDPRSEAFAKNFAGQWLRLRNVDGIDPNARMFPDFDDNLRRAMRRETGVAVREHSPRGPQCAGVAGCRLPLRERAACQALRDPERVRQSFQAVPRSPMSIGLPV